MVTQSNRDVLQKGKCDGVGRINKDFGINIHTLLYIKYRTNNDLLCNTGNATQ